MVVPHMQPQTGGAAKDARVLEMAYERYGATAFALAHRLCGDPAQAEEVVREAFLSLWRCTRSRPADVEALGPPLYALVHQKAAAICPARASGAAPHPLGDRKPTPDGSPGSHPPHSSHGSDGSHGRFDDGSPPGAGPRPADGRVLEALRRLEPGCREALELAYLGGLTYRQVAGALGVSEAMAKGRLREGMAHLRRLLGGGDGTSRPRTIVLDGSLAVDGFWCLWSEDPVTGAR